MTTTECAACHQPVPLHAAVRRSDLRTVRSWHRDCYTVARAVQDVVAPEMALSLRMLLAAADERL